MILLTYKIDVHPSRSPAPENVRPTRYLRTVIEEG